MKGPIALLLAAIGGTFTALFLYNGFVAGALIEGSVTAFLLGWLVEL